MKKIIKSICFSFLAFMFAIGSIFLPVGQKNQKYANASPPPELPSVLYQGSYLGNDIIYADLRYANNSTLITDFSRYGESSGMTYNSSISYLNFRMSVIYDNGGNFSVGYIANRYSVVMHPVGESPSFNRSYITSVNDVTDNNIQLNFRPNTNLDIYGVTPMQKISVDSLTYYYNFGFEVFRNNSDTSSFVSPSLDMYYCILTNSFEIESYLGITPKFTNSNIICYVDTAGYYYIFYIPIADTVYDEQSTSFYLEFRRYILKEADFSNNEYYQQGLNSGYESGYSSGYTEGYNLGQDTGYDNGFENGKIQGALESNNYSFFGLISAVIDAPVKILTSLFNFNFLGVNLWAFFTSILTISLIVFVIRKFMAKG